MKEEIKIDEQDEIVGTFLYFRDYNITLQVVKEFMFQVRGYLYQMGIDNYKEVYEDNFFENNYFFSLIKNSYGDNIIVLKDGIDIDILKHNCEIKNETLKLAMQNEEVKSETIYYLNEYNNHKVKKLKK